MSEIRMCHKKTILVDIYRQSLLIHLELKSLQESRF